MLNHLSKDMFHIPRDRDWRDWSNPSVVSVFGRGTILHYCALRNFIKTWQGIHIVLETKGILVACEWTSQKKIPNKKKVRTSPGPTAPFYSSPRMGSSLKVRSMESTVHLRIYLRYTWTCFFRETTGLFLVFPDCAWLCTKWSVIWISHCEAMFKESHPISNLTSCGHLLLTGSRLEMDDLRNRLKKTCFLFQIIILYMLYHENKSYLNPPSMKSAMVLLSPGIKFTLQSTSATATAHATLQLP